MSIMAAGAVHFDRYRGIIEGKGLTLACPRMISQLSPSKNNLAIHIFLLFFLFSRNPIARADYSGLRVRIIFGIQTTFTGPKNREKL